MRTSHALIPLLALTCATPLGAQDARRLERAGSARRLALCIGNDAYQHATPLRNAAADAQAMGAELQAAGFEATVLTDLDRRGMNRAVDDFVARLSAGAIAVFFFAGHGVQIQNTNYLMPTDVLPERPADVANDALDLGRTLEKITSAAPAFSLAIVDACRDNPFAASGRSLGTGRGLAPPSSTPRGFMIVYSAGANQAALDRLGPDDRSPNGLFTRELLAVMRRPGLRVQDAITEARLSVIEQAARVGHEQTPAVYDQSTGSFYFRTAEGPAAAAPPPAYRPPAYPPATAPPPTAPPATAAPARIPAAPAVVAPVFEQDAKHEKWGMPAGKVTASARSLSFAPYDGGEGFEVQWSEVSRACVAERSVLGFKEYALLLELRSGKKYRLLPRSAKVRHEADYGSDRGPADALLQNIAAARGSGFAPLAAAEVLPDCKKK